jgi:hypothetical protein
LLAAVRHQTKPTWWRELPIHFAGSEIVEFSSTDALGESIAVVLGNLRAAGVEA